jgi:Leucine-rich repeat (LRR) protein
MAHGGVGDLAHRKIASIPEDAKEIFALTPFLNLSYNSLTMVPDWLGFQRQLERLNLAHNALTLLPAGIAQLPALLEVDLSNNRFEALTDVLGWSKLKDLQLSNNLLTRLPDLGQLVSLTELCVRNNKLTLLPESLGSMVALVRLDVQFNEVCTQEKKTNKNIKLGGK